MIVTKRDSMASLIHDTSSTLRHSLQRSHNKGLYYGFRDAILSRLDILISVSTEEKHQKTLDEVLSRLNKAGLRVKRSKCEFMRESVTYLGHRIDADGLHPLPDRLSRKPQSRPP